MIVLDTQVVAWLAREPQRLPRPARMAIEREQRRRGLAASSVALMELAAMAADGRIRIVDTPTQWLRSLVAGLELSLLEVSTDIAGVAAFLPRDFPADPFDRVITATAIVERVPLVTSDRGIRGSGVVQTIW